MRRKLAGLIGAAASLNGCITVKAPDKPIEVNLNVDIKQEVLVRLQQDVQQMIQRNPQAFPPAPTSQEAMRVIALRSCSWRPAVPQAAQSVRLERRSRRGRPESAMMVIWATPGAPSPKACGGRSQAINLRRRNLYIELATRRGVLAGRGRTDHGVRVVRPVVAWARPIC